MTRLLLSATSSGAGKTTLTLGILRALKRQGLDIFAAKSGPDYIDPRFHETASGAPSLNLDAWAMPREQLLHLSNSQNLVVEGAMGLFDGAGLEGRGSAADLANILDLPVVLIVDAAKMAHSVAAIVSGFMTQASGPNIAGIILNRVGSPRHEAMLRHALRQLDVDILGCVPRLPDLVLPERHLGLVQASEHDHLEIWIDGVADIVEKHLDMARLSALHRDPQSASYTNPPPPAQRLAIAQDVAFEFCYPHQANQWRSAGAEVTFFSPLNDDPVPEGVDWVFLPGGYPELHAGRLADNHQFLKSLRSIPSCAPVYGECGGYMVLGEGLIDKDGRRHQMAGLLPLETSFEHRKLHLGYRQLTPLTPAFNASLKAHEFHYCTTLRADGPPLFQAKDADGQDLGEMGLHIGKVYGSFAHLI